MMKSLPAPLQQALDGLSQRERHMVLAAALVVGVLLLWLLVWEPVSGWQTRAAQTLDTQRALAQRLAQAAALQQQRGPGQPVDRSTALLTVVDRSSRGPTLGKAPSRVQPDGEQTVKVWLEDVAYEKLLAWLIELQGGYGIRPSSLEIERSEHAGTVDARLTLQR